MKMDHRRKALLILGIYLLATLALLFGGYSVREPAVKMQEFPFTITYTYRGSTRTIEEVYVAEYCRTDQYIGDDDITWYGYVRGLEPTGIGLLPGGGGSGPNLLYQSEHRARIPHGRPRLRRCRDRPIGRQL